MDSVLADTLTANLKSAATPEAKAEAQTLALIALVDCQHKTSVRVKQLVAEQKMTVALIEHNMGVVRKLADYIYFLHEGTVYAHGTQQDVLDNPEVRDLYTGNSGGATL